MKPWIADEAELQGFLGSSADEPRSEVLVTNPASGPGDGVPVGRAIRAALHGRTRSLSMLVGFFGDGSAGETPEDTPLGLIRNEAAEELILPPELGCAPPADQAEFRLLFGALAGDSRGARLAVIAFWWTCRWRSLDQAAADAWRDALVETWRAEEHGVNAGTDFEQFALRAFATSEVDGLFGIAQVLSESERASFSAWRQELKAADDKTRAAAAVLATFFVLRRAHIRLQAPDTSADGQRGLFHGKLYVVERGTEGDTVAIMGSPNWSTGALFGSGTHANTEVAAISRCSGWQWDHEVGPASLASRLAQTARLLFCDAERTTLLASWSLTDGVLPDLDSLLKLLAEAKQRGDAFTEPEEPSPPATVLAAIDPGLVPLAAGLLALIERTLGLAGEAPPARRFIDEHLARTKNMFAGKRVQAAQIDGAIRLLEMLRDTPMDDTALGGRGAFLADEAGLGKSIVAQLVAFGLTLEKLLDPRRSDTPRVTILAPRQLVVSEAGAGPDSGQWKRHRLELLEELHRALTAMQALSDDGAGARVQQALDWVIREQSATALHERRVRVLSHSTFQRTLRFDDTGEDVIRDHAHLAASEVVVLDESHNLRNGSSSRTRLARFLLSLPVPGEDWPVWVRRGTESRRLNPPAPDNRYARRVLCLTATPFNNAFEDIVTQIGHFGRSQTWLVSPTEAAGQLALDGLESPLLSALDAWTTAPAEEAHEAEGEGPRLRAFGSLLEAVAVPKEGRSTSHLGSGRRLDPDPAKEEFDEDTLKAADGGPVYTWPGPYNELKHVVVVVATVLAQLVDEREDAQPPSAAAVADATQRLDALLGRMFVQRSRSRIIKLMPDEDADRQFRMPRLPRLPLPLNEDGGDQVARAEVRILDRLFKQLGEEGTDGLSLFAYRLSTIRSGAGVAGSSEQKSSNLLGFQRMQLIKRLQSSRYAFLQTLLRGPLRRSLIELALLESIADDVQNVVLAEAPKDWRARVRSRAQEALKMLQRRTSDEVSWGAMLSLAVRGHANRETGAWTLRSWLLGAQPDVDVARELLGSRVAGRIDATLRPGASPQQREWLERAVADLASDQTCQLLTDVETCLDWAFRDQRLELSAVVPFLSRETLRALEADVESSNGNRGLLSALRRHLTAHGLGKDRDDLFDWLKKQLDEPRICGLLGWALGQAAARADGIEARGGYRTLVFTEYSDTVDHIAVVFQVVTLLAAEELASSATRSALADLLLRHTRDAVDLVNEHALRVHEEVPQYEAPIAAFSKLFAMPEGPERRRFVLELAAQLARFSGIRTGEGAARLAGGVDATLVASSEDSDADLVEELDEATDEAVNDSPATEALVDAFAPWYRIDPLTVASAAVPDPIECAAALRRLDAAARQPLYTLVSTEVLAEGVNLQECGVVLHFDLPWNPTRLIQRNGRVDRRIQYRYESKHGRERVWRTLVDGAESVWDGAPPVAPDLHAPQQVYHLTAVPPEPSLDHPDEEQRELLRQKVESVRRTLLRKLRSIQILFGLSSWPIVLRAQESRAILSGELEVETPGFRRREELYARRADLLDRLGDGHQAPVGTVRVRVEQPPLRTAIARRLAGPKPGAAWAHLLEVGVQSWTQGAAPGLPVRSGTQWQEGVRAITAWATIFDGDTASLLRWARRGESKNNVRRFSATPALSTAVWHDKFGWLVSTPGIASLPTLALESQPEHDLRVHPLSPTGAAEELLDEIVQWLVTGRVSPGDVAIDAGDSPSVPPPPQGRSAATTPGSYFAGAWQQAGLPVEAKASTATDYPAASMSDEAPPALNLKLVFQRGATS